MLATLLAVFAVHIVAAMSPGPAVLMAARVAMEQGLRIGAALAVGLGLGAVAWASAALFGLAALFELAPRLLIALKLIGAAYLIYLAVRMWKSAAAPLALPPTSGPHPQPSISQRPFTPLRAVMLGITTQLANPKPAVFFGAVFVSVVPVGADLKTLIAVLLIVFANEVLWNTFIARLFSLDATRARYLALKTPIDRILGGMLAALGLKIAAT